jgi:transmembrane sensor
MSNETAHVDSERAIEEAAEWLARRDRGLSAEENAQLREWAREPGNERALMEVARCWHGMDSMSVLADLFPLSAAIQTSRPPRRVSLATAAAAAAAVVCILILGVVYLSGTGTVDVADTQQVAQSAAPLVAPTYSTSVGESLTIRPDDGSVITLNTGSTVSVKYSPTARDVFLTRGEASFEVAHDPSRPFNVHVGERVLQAVGTAFNVRVLSVDRVELTVTEGKVRVLPDRDGADSAAGEAALTPVETTVSAQESVTMQADAEPVRRLDPAELDARVAWQRGMLIFKGETLDFVLSEVDRYTNTEFVLEDQALRNVRVGGYFRTGDIDGLLAALSANFGIASRREGANRIVLSANSAP